MLHQNIFTLSLLLFVLRTYLENQNLFFQETFDSADCQSSWTYSGVKNSPLSSKSYTGEFKRVKLDDNDNHGLQMMDQNSYYGYAKLLKWPFFFNRSMLIVQYHVKIPSNLTCGGAYIKLLSTDDKIDLSLLGENTPFTIMFGPDRCGSLMRFHFIFQHKNPLNDSYEEKHLKDIPINKFSHIFSDNAFHLLKLKLFNTNTYQILLDHRIISSGSLFTNFIPPVNPPEFIEDPEDTKPQDWDDREFIPDPSVSKPVDVDQSEPPYIPDPKVKKPDDWLEDEAEFIPDPTAVVPSDWDDSVDGEWEADLIENPKCKNKHCGKWTPPQIPNPKFKKWETPLIKNLAYKGKFKPRVISNPNFFKDKNPYKMCPFSAIGFELWAVEQGVIFDNILITSDEGISNHFDSVTFTQNRFQLLFSFINQKMGFFFTDFLDSIYFVPALVVTILLVILSTLFFVFRGNSTTSTRSDEIHDVPPQPNHNAEHDEDPLSDLHERSSINVETSSNDGKNSE